MGVAMLQSSVVTFPITATKLRRCTILVAALMIGCAGPAGAQTARQPPPAAPAPTVPKAPKAPQAAVQPPPAIIEPEGFAGVWLDDTGDGAVEIASCGDRLCGWIVWLKQPTDKGGRPLTDGYNPESTQRSRPICGLPVIGDLRRQSNGTWDDGWIYDPKEGKSYDVELRTAGLDRLKVTGYLGTKFLSETFIWTRAPATLPRCTTSSASSAPVPVPVR